MAGISVKSDVPDRKELERRLARKLGRLGKNWMAKLLEELGNFETLESAVEAFLKIPPRFWDQFGKELAALLGPFIEERFLDQARDLMLEQPIGVDWALVNEAAISFAHDYSFELVKNINKTSQNTLRRAITAYFERGQPIGELERSISHVFGPTRSEAIAVTEITRASAEGEYQIAKDLRKQGVDMIAFWQTNEDEKVCPICAPLNDRQASGYDALGKPYWIHPSPKYSGNQYQHPAHPRCRCWPRHELPKVKKT